MKKNQNFLEWNNGILINSLKKINFDIAIIIALDALFYFLSAYFFIFWFKRIQEKMAAFNLPADAMSLGYEGAQQLISDAKAFYYLLIFSFVLVLIAIIFIASILKGIIWAKTTKTKITFALISKFLGLNMIWMSFWFLAIFLASYLVKIESATRFMAAAIILGLYFTNTLYTIFMKEQKLKSIIGAVKLNITKIHLFLLPYAVMLLLFYVIIRLGNLLKFRYSPVLLGLIILVYAAVARYYASELAFEIKKV